MKSTEKLMNEIYADGLPVSREIDGPIPEDLEWSVSFHGFRRENTQKGLTHLVDFYCPGCNHLHKDINFVGWSALICQGCGATLTREESSHTSWGYEMLSNINRFWSLVLQWLHFNKPCLKISGRVEAREFCHKFGVTLEEFVFFNDLNQDHIDEYLHGKLP
tara:strand:- start:257 stop:742 length:486 start_codon:yes stop_codon:yes gene_type:complete